MTIPWLIVIIEEYGAFVHRLTFTTAIPNLEKRVPGSFRQNFDLLCRNNKLRPGRRQKFEQGNIVQDTMLFKMVKYAGKKMNQAVI